jgi:hypothetical protein
MWNRYKGRHTKHAVAQRIEQQARRAQLIENGKRADWALS